MTYKVKNEDVKYMIQIMDNSGKVTSTLENLSIDEMKKCVLDATINNFNYKIFEYKEIKVSVHVSVASGNGYR